MISDPCRTSVVFAATALVCLIAGCGGADESQETRTQQGSAPASARVGSERPSPCSKEQVARLLNKFAAALSRGEVGRVEAMIAERPWFQVYGSNPPGARMGLEAKDRESLEAYLRERRRQDEELKVTEFRFNGNSGGFGNFQFTGIRSADDAAAGTVTRRVKGAAVCFGEKAQLAVVAL